MQEYAEILSIYRDFYAILLERYIRVLRGEEFTDEEEEELSPENVRRVLGMIREVMERLERVEEMIGRLERWRGGD